MSHSQDLSVRSNFTLTEIQSIIFLSVLVLSDGTSGTTLSPATSYRVCERNTTTGQFTNVGFSVDKRQSQMEDPVCSTFDTPLRSTGLLVELMIIKTNAILDARCYDLVITTEEECSNMSPDATNKVHFTICNCKFVYFQVTIIFILTSLSPSPFSGRQSCNNYYHFTAIRY